MSKKFTITAALPYANGPLHLGHIAGVYLPGDIFSRFSRMMGDDVLYVCGSDEHGAAITLRAKKEGISPQEIVDKYHLINKKAFQDFQIDFDIYHRTSSEIHHETAADWFSKLEAKGKFTKETSEQYFDEEHQQFLADRYIVGECPKCHSSGAYGDQCEKCGSSLSPTELINPKSTLSGSAPILKSTSHWYLPMEQHEAWLRDWIKEGILDGKKQHDPKLWRNQVVGQCMSWIDGGLQARAMTRDLDWGVKVPVEGGDGKVLYVWLDAPIGYVSATKQWCLDNNKNWEDYWTGDRKLVHFIGKDNIVFHCIIFPILLKEYGGLVLPDNVPAYEFLNLEGDKFSTSRNWAVWLHEFIADHPDKIDELKFTLTAIAPESKDSEFTWKEFQARVNNELADILGNFVNRALVLSNKYYEGKVPKRGELTQEDQELLAKIGETRVTVEDLLYRYKIREAQTEVMNLARAGNKYLADNEPWKLVKADPIRVETIMNLALEITANLAVLLAPFLPIKSKKIADFLNIDQNQWKKVGEENLLNVGDTINQPEILVQKIDDIFIEEELKKLEASKEVEITYEAVKEEIQFEDFTKMDIRIGTIVAAEKIKKANKLLQLSVDLGFEIRTIVSGIAEYYAPEDLIGTKVTVLLNLAPRNIRGVESNGMILMAENPDGELSFVSPGKSHIANGSEVR